MGNYFGCCCKNGSSTSRLQGARGKSFRFSRTRRRLQPPQRSSSTERLIPDPGLLDLGVNSRSNKSSLEPEQASSERSRSNKSPLEPEQASTERSRSNKSPLEPEQASTERSRSNKSPLEPEQTSTERSRSNKSPLEPEQASTERSRSKKSPLESEQASTERSRSNKSSVSRSTKSPLEPEQASTERSRSNKSSVSRSNQSPLEPEQASTERSISDPRVDFDVNSPSKRSLSDPGVDSGVNSTSKRPISDPGVDSGPKSPSEQSPLEPEQLQASASTSSPSQGLPSENRSGKTSDMINDLKTALDFIDSALYAQRYAKPMNETNEVRNYLDKNSKDAEKALKEIVSVKHRRQVEVKDVAQEAGNLLGKKVGDTGSLGSVSAAFSMVSLVLRRLNDMAETRSTCLSVLENLQRLSDQLVRHSSSKTITGEDGKMAAKVIVEGAVLCISQLDSTLGRRFARVDKVKESIEELEGKIQSLYPELVTQRRMTKPMNSYQGEIRKDAVGLEKTIHHVMDIMKAATQEAGKEKTPAILLHGMGGIGKTTLGEAVCARFSAEDYYDYTVAKIQFGQNPDSRKICECQRHIVEVFCQERQEIEDPSKGRALLEKKLGTCTTPILLFIDNVFDRKDLNDFLPRTLSLPRHSYILVTSRYSKVSQGLHRFLSWKKYEVEGLEKREAETFLDTFLDKCPPDRKEQFNIVLDLCSGWPLALQTVGSYLGSSDFDKDDSSVWDGVIARLKMCRDVEGIDDSNNAMIQILKWTYERIAPESQDVLLDTCCLLRDADWDWVKSLGPTGLEWETLKSFSLVKEKVVKLPVWEDHRFNDDFGEGDSRAVVQVHDAFVALAKQVSKRGVRVCVTHQKQNPLAPILQAGYDEDECERVEGLTLDGDAIDLSAKRLDAMHKRLRVLYLGQNVRVRGVCRTTPSNLQICAMASFPYTNLSGLQDLRVLHIDGYNLDDMHIRYEQWKLPKRLQVLYLSSLPRLEHFDAEAFRGCDVLHSVRIRECQNLRELPASICFCKKIRVLILQENKNLTSLPRDFSRLFSLEKFSFSGSQESSEFPSGFAGLRKLREVFVPRIGGMAEDVDFSQLPMLERLYLGYVPVQRSISSGLSQPPLQAPHHHGFEKLPSLRVLRIGDCERIQTLTDDISRLKALKQLHLRGCKSLQRLPDALSQLASLEDLDLTYCTSLTELPREFGSLRALKFLTLVGCENLQQLPFSFSELHALLKLNLLGCKTLNGLPRGFEKLHLTHIDLGRCSNLQKLPENFGHLVMLEDVRLSGCESLELLPESFGDLQKLTELDLSDCADWKALPESTFRLKHLKWLQLKGWKNLECLPEELGHFEELVALDLSDCANLKALPESTIQLKRLITLTLHGCKSLKLLPRGLGDLEHLNELDLSDCANLEELPESIIRSRLLNRLNLRGCKHQVQSLQQQLSDLDNLFWEFD